MRRRTLVTGDLAPREAAWRRFLTELDWWVKRYGDAAVPQTATSRDGYPLGRRVKAYRVAHRRGGLSAARVDELTARAGWTWDGFGARAARAWGQNLELVREHARRHGGLAGLEGANAPAARWLRDQRTAALSTEQRRELATIPGALQERRGRLEAFTKALHDWISAEPDRDASSIRFSTITRVDGADYPLGKRAAYWRARRAAGRLTPDETTALAAVPGWRWRPPGAPEGPP